MKQYRAKEVITLASGSVVALDEKQAADRKGRVERLAPGRYRLKDSLQFKRGEVFGCEGELPKALADVVEALAAKEAEQEVGAASAKARK